MKKQKEKRSPGPIVLDAYKNTLLTIVACALILAVLIPFVVFSLNRLDKDITLQGDEARAVYGEVNEKFNVAEYNSATIESSSFGDMWVREQFNFLEGQLVSRVVCANATPPEGQNFFEEEKTVWRKVTDDDRALVEAAQVDLSQGFERYKLITTDCIKEQYTLGEGGIYVSQSKELDSTDALNMNFSSLEGLISQKTMGSEIETLSAKVDYNLFGVGYKYVTASFTDKNNNTILFEDAAVTLTLSGGEVYNLSFKVK